MPLQTSSIAKFFDRYLTAFNRQDATVIAEHYAFPMFTTMDTGSIQQTAIASKAELLTQLARLLAMYRAIGFRSARALRVSPAQLSDKLMQVSVEWELLGNQGESLYNFQATYTVVLLEEDLRITAVAHNEIARYRECLARVQAPIGNTLPAAG